MTETLIQLAYLVAAFLFLVALRAMGSVRALRCQDRGSGLIL